MSNLKKKKVFETIKDYRSENTTFVEDENVVLGSTITMLNPCEESIAKNCKNIKMDSCVSEALPSVTIDAPYSAFSRYTKFLIVFTVPCSSIVSSMSANIYLPAVSIIQNDLAISAQMVNLTITMYMVIQAVSPSFWGTLADSWGRRPIYIATFSIYILACIGLAYSKNYATLLSLRMLQAFGSSSAIALGAGTIGDIASPVERGNYMGIYSMGTTAGQMIGPFLGGTLGHHLGWRWIFWFLVIFSACLAWMLQVFFLPETLRKLVGDGSGYANPTPIQYLKKRKYAKKPTIEKDSPFIGSKCTTTYDNALSLSTSIAADPLSPEKDSTSDREMSRRGSRFFIIPNPFQSLLFFKEKDVLIILLYTSLQYGAMFSVLSSITELFIDSYVINEYQVGLCFLSSGFGAASGSFISGKLLNWRFEKIGKRLGFADIKRGNLDQDFPIERVRMGVTWIYGVLFNAILILYGWCIHYRIHLSVPVIFIFILGFTNAAHTLLVDLFPDNSAAIIACYNIPRCLTGGFAVMLVHPGIQQVGAGWFFTTLSVVLFLSRLTIILELKYGPQWRKERYERLNKTMHAV